MPLKESDAVVLRTYPMREADLLVTLFTRAEGKVRGVARSAMKSRRRFGGALEPLSVVRAYWHDKPGVELARLDSCDVVASPLMHEVDYARAAALAHVGEMLDELLPDREANDVVFRLTLAVLAQLQVDEIWMSVTYFDLWMTRLMGFLPDLSHCMACGAALDGGRAFFHAAADGLRCEHDRRLASSEMTPESRQMAALMFRAPIETFASEPWTKARFGDLRKFCVQIVERHIEKKLTTAAVLERIG